MSLLVLLILLVLPLLIGVSILNGLALKKIIDKKWILVVLSFVLALIELGVLEYFVGWFEPYIDFALDLVGYRYSI